MSEVWTILIKNAAGKTLTGYDFMDYEQARQHLDWLESTGRLADHTADVLPRTEFDRANLEALLAELAT